MVSDLFFCQLSWNSNDWIVRNQHVSAKAIDLNFSTYGYTQQVLSFQDAGLSVCQWILFLFTLPLISQIPLVTVWTFWQTVRWIHKLFERFDKPFERFHKPFKRFGKPFEKFHEPFECFGELFKEIHELFKRLGCPFGILNKPLSHLMKPFQTA